MLNAGNLALVAFSCAHGNAEGQVFALIVMVVAACEVSARPDRGDLPAPPAAQRRRPAELG
jgi:hypothetical protein